MEDQIKSEFNKIGFELEDEEEILKKCLAFCINYNLKPSDIVSSWEVYYLNRQLSESTVHNSEMDGFLLHLQNEQKEAIIKEESGCLHTYSSKDVDMILNGGGDAEDDIIGTPTRNYDDQYADPFSSTPHTDGKTYSSRRTPGLITPFGQRTQKFVVKFSIDSKLDVEDGQKNIDMEIQEEEDDLIRKVQPGKRCSLMVHGSKPEAGCRFMYNRVEDTFDALENRIQKHVIAFASSQLYPEPVDPSVSSQNIFAVGMICCEDGEGHLKENSILLQSGVEHSGGQRVRLELQNMDKFSIFPGQIVGIEGHNPSGHCLIASKVIDSIPLADVNLHPSKKQAVDKKNESNDLSVIVASGPFTTSDNLLYEPLVELLAYAKRKTPQLLILVGPFVDSEHPEIMKRTADMTFDEIFRLEVLKRLEDYAEYMGSHSRVILVPSIRDTNHDFVFPQPPFDIQPSDIEHQLISLTNPGIFKANQVKIGCCSVDILKHLSSVQISRNPKGGAPVDRMGGLANHILGQRSFYPLYPPAEGVPVDFSLAPEALEIALFPNILIIPSDMKHFVKLISVGEGEGEQAKCVCINPGRLSKGEGGGTFVELRYHGDPDETSASIIGI